MTQDARYHPYHVIERRTRKGKKFSTFDLSMRRPVVPVRNAHRVKRLAQQPCVGPRWRWRRSARDRRGLKRLHALADGFWDWDAPYPRGRKARGKSISHGTLDIAEANTKNHIVPRWGKTNVADITAAEMPELGYMSG